MVPSRALSRTITIVTAILMIGSIALLGTEWITGRTLTVTYVVGVVADVVAPISLALAVYTQYRRRSMAKTPAPGIGWRLIVLYLVTMAGCLVICGELAVRGEDLTMYGSDLIFLDAAFMSSLADWRRA